MGFQEAVVTCFRRYFQFSGRAGRPENWWFMLFCAAGGVFSSLLEGGGQVFGVIVLLPSMTVGWRRLHDAGLPGWIWLLPFFVPVLSITIMSAGAPMSWGVAVFLGGFALSIAAQLLFLLPSHEGENRYGPEPAR